MKLFFYIWFLEKIVRDGIIFDVQVDDKKILKVIEFQEYFLDFVI